MNALLKRFGADGARFSFIVLLFFGILRVINFCWCWWLLIVAIWKEICVGSDIEVVCEEKIKKMKHTTKPSPSCRLGSLTNEKSSHSAPTTCDVAEVKKFLEHL